MAENLTDDQVAGVLQLRKDLNALVEGKPIGLLLPVLLTTTALAITHLVDDADPKKSASKLAAEMGQRLQVSVVQAYAMSLKEADTQGQTEPPSHR